MINTALITPTIFDIISYVESKNNQYAMRFEPKTFAHFSPLKSLFFSSKIVHSIIERIATLNKCSVATAEVIYSSSFGAAQIMGFNLYGSCEYGRTIGEYLNSPVDQLIAFKTFLSINDLIDVTPLILAGQPNARLNFAIKYNGSIAYEKPLIEALQFFKLPIIVS